LLKTERIRLRVLQIRRTSKEARWFPLARAPLVVANSRALDLDVETDQWVRAMADDDVLDIVWGETGLLIPKDGQDTTLARLHAAVGKVAIAAKASGLGGKLRRAPAPRVGEPGAATYEKMKSTLDAVRAGTWSGPPLPARAAIWEITASGSPRIDGLVPQAARWILDQDVASGGEFVLASRSDGRIYRLFESKGSAPNDELPLVSMVSGTGMAQAAAASTGGLMPWVLGIGGVILLIFGGALSAWSGAGMSAGRNALAAASPAAQYQLVLQVAAACARDSVTIPFGARVALCDSLLGDQKQLELPRDAAKINWGAAAAVLAAARACPAEPTKDGCNTLWRAAVAAGREEGKGGLLGWMHAAASYFNGARSESGSISIVAPFLIALVGIASLVIGLGLGTKGRAAGLWIDTRNRVSLSRAQVTLWTVVAFAGYTVLAMFNIGFGGILSSSADFASYQAFPLLPASIAAALGIAAASPMLSALILPTKDKAGPELQFAIAGGSGDGSLQARGLPFFGAASSGLDKRASPALASIADIFMGEETANAGTVDLSRLQNVVITIMLVTGFGSVLMGMMSDISAVAMLAAKGAIFPSLPELGTTFTSLLLVSHATYLVAKAFDAQGPRPQA
jgi:hypothetical protein